MIDIVRGLRRIAEEGYRFASDAADEIERLRAQNANLIAAATNPAAITELLDRLEAAERERDALRAALEKIADWNGAWGPYPERNEAWRAMALVTAREAVRKEYF